MSGRVCCGCHSEAPSRLRRGCARPEPYGRRSTTAVPKFVLSMQCMLTEHGQSEWASKRPTCSGCSEPGASKRNFEQWAGIPPLRKIGQPGVARSRDQGVMGSGKRAAEQHTRAPKDQKRSSAVYEMGEGEPVRSMLILGVGAGD